MKELLLIFMLSPLLSTAQIAGPRFENDTLYTTSGFKIYEGQTLQFGKGTGKNGKFRFVNIKSGANSKSLTNNSVFIKELKNFAISSLGNGYIEITGSITYKDSTKGYINIHMAFDHAIESSPGFPSELIVPDVFRNDQKRKVTEEIDRLYKLYKNGAISESEYETLKKKLLEQ